MSHTWDQIENGRCRLLQAKVDVYLSCLPRKWADGARILTVVDLERVVYVLRPVGDQNAHRMDHIKRQITRNQERNMKRCCGKDSVLSYYLQVGNFS